MEKKKKYRQLNNVEMPEHLVQGQKALYLSQLPLRHQRLNNSDSQIALIRLTRSFDKIQTLRPWPKTH